MDVRFPAFQPFATGGAAASPGAPGVRGTAGLPGATSGLPGATSNPADVDASASFSGALKDALQGVSRLQEESSGLQRRFLMGDESASLEQTMMAMQKSQVAFQAALTVRTRLVAAYTDIMNMPV